MQPTEERTSPKDTDTTDTLEELYMAIEAYFPQTQNRCLMEEKEISWKGFQGEEIHNTTNFLHYFIQSQM